MLIRALGASPVAAETTAAARRAGAFGIRRASLPGIRTPPPKTPPRSARFMKHLVERLAAPPPWAELRARACHTKVDSRLLCTARGKLEPCACRTQQALDRRALDTNPSPRFSSPHGRPLWRFSVQASPGEVCCCRSTGTAHTSNPSTSDSEDRPSGPGRAVL